MLLALAMLTVAARVDVGALDTNEEVVAAVQAALGGDALDVVDRGRRLPSGPSRDRGDAILVAIGTSKQACRLRSLSLDNVRLTPTGLHALGSACLKLERLSVTASTIDDDAASAFRALPSRTSLHWLRLASVRTSEVALGTVLRALPSLEELHLNDNIVGVRGPALALLRGQWPRLRVLDLAGDRLLDGAPLGTSGARLLANARFPALEVLDLTGNGIRPAGLRALVASGHVARLRSLALVDNGIFRAPAAELGAAAPHVDVKLEPRAMGGWSRARVRALRVGEHIPVDVVLSSDDDVRALAGARMIRGSLTITSDVRLLLPLRLLQTVDGDLRIERTTGLVSLRGLEQLVSIGGDVVLERNSALRDTAGLAGLQHVGGAIVVVKNRPGLVLRPFARLTSLGERSSLVTDRPALFPRLARAPSRQLPSTTRGP